MDFFAVRLLASFAIDFSLAWLCGLLLVRLWLGADNRPGLPSLLYPAATLLAGDALQLLSLTAAFTGRSGLATLVRAVPDIVATHAGAVLALSLAAALLLVGLVLLPARGRQPGAAAGLLVCLVFRAGAGHAASETVFSGSHLLQFVHLAAMAAWSGGVLVAGGLVLPRLAGKAKFPGLLRSLSRSSTVAVGVVLLTGLLKGYRSVEGDLHHLVDGAWGVVLVLKLVCVAVALGLGGLNRLWLGRMASAPTLQLRSVRALRAEALAMAVVLALSAGLANLSPPGE